MARSVLYNGRVIAMWGMCGVYVSDEGQPWLVTAPEVERLPFAVLREAKKGVAEMLDLKPFLWNYVAADYAQAVKMLEILGFTLDPSVTLPTGVDFRRFWMRRG